MITGRTNRQTTTSPCATNNSSVEYLGRILKLHPYLKLLPNSLLNIAVQQEYNNVKGTTSRMPWPQDLCGYIENIAKLQSANRKQRTSASVNIRGVPDTQYPQDECIDQKYVADPTLPREVQDEILNGAHLPGSFTYGKCTTEENLIEDLFNMDWTAFFEDPVFPTLDNLSDEDKERMDDIYGPQVDELIAAGESALAAIYSQYGEGGIATGPGVAGSFYPDPLETTYRFTFSGGGVLEFTDYTTGDQWGAGKWNGSSIGGKVNDIPWIANYARRGQGREYTTNTHGERQFWLADADGRRDVKEVVIYEDGWAPHVERQVAACLEPFSGDILKGSTPVRRSTPWRSHPGSIKSCEIIKLIRKGGI